MSSSWALDRVLGRPGPVATFEWGEGDCAVSRSFDRGWIVKHGGIFTVDLRAFEERRVVRWSERRPNWGDFCLSQQADLYVGVASLGGEQQVIVWDLRASPVTESVVLADAGPRAGFVKSMDGRTLVVFDSWEPDRARFVLHDGQAVAPGSLLEGFTQNDALVSLDEFVAFREGALWIHRRGEDASRISVSARLGAKVERLSPISRTCVALQTRRGIDRAASALFDVGTRRLTKLVGLRPLNPVADGDDLIVHDAGLISVHSLNDLRVRSQFIPLRWSSPRVVELTPEHIVFVSHGRFARVSRERAAFAERESADGAAIRSVFVCNEGAVLSQDIEGTIVARSATSSVIGASSRSFMDGSRPDDLVVGVIDGGASVLVYRRFGEHTVENVLAALSVRDGEFVERWALRVPAHTARTFNADASVIVLALRDAKKLLWIDRRSGHTIRVEQAVRTIPTELFLTDDHVLHGIGGGQWASYERVEERLVRRKSIALNRLELRELRGDDLEAERASALAMTEHGPVPLVGGRASIAREAELVATVPIGGRKVHIHDWVGNLLAIVDACDPDDPDDYVWGLALSPDGRWLAVGSARGVVRVFRRPTLARATLGGPS